MGADRRKQGRAWGWLAALALCLSGSAALADEAVDSWVSGMLALNDVGSSPEGLVPDMQLTISDSPDPAPVNSVVTYVAAIDFTSPSPGVVANSTQVTFFYSAGMVFQSGSGAGWSCSGGAVVQCSFGGTLVSPQSTQVSLQFMMPATPQSVQLRGTASYVGTTDGNPANNTNITQTTQVIAVGGNLSLGLQAGSSSVVAGAPVSFTAKVDNSGPGDVSGVTLNGTASGPLSLSTATGTGWSCSVAGASFNCSYGPALISGNSTPNLTISGTSGPGGGTAQLSATANATGALAPAPATAAVTVLAPPSVTLTKTDSVDPVQVGQNFFYTLTATNTGGSALTGLTILDNLPVELDFIGSSGAGWSCSGGSQGVACQLGSSLAPGASSTLRIDVRALTDGEVTNTATISDATNSANANAAQSTTIVDQPQLSFTKRANRSQVPVGETVRFDLTVRNNGSSTATGLQVSDRIPDGLSFVSAAGQGWSCNQAGLSVLCNRASLAAGSESTIAVEMSALGPPGNIVNTASLTVASGSPQPASAVVNVIDDMTPPTPPDLSLSKVDDVDPVNVGSEFGYLLTVANSGGDTQAPITLLDELPAGLSLVSAGGSGWNCSGSSVISCSFTGILASGTSAQVSVRVRAPDVAGSVLNQASVSTAGEENTANNSASETTSVVVDGGGGQPLVADLTLQGSVAPMSAVPDAAVAYTIQPLNNGPDRVPSISLSGLAVRGLALLSADGNGYECQVQGTAFSCSGPALSAGAGAPLTISARLTGAPGSLGSLSARISSGVQDPNLTNNDIGIDALIDNPPPAGADLQLSKQASANPVEAGAAFSYTLTVSNAGPAAAEQVTLLDNLPAGLSFVSVQGSGLSCSGGPAVSCQVASIPAGSSVSAIINVRAPTVAGDVQNTANVSAATMDPNPGNNSASATVGVDERSAVGIEQELTALIINDPTAAAAAGPVSQLCADPAPAFAEQCRILLQAADAGQAGDVSEALRAIAPDEVLGQTAAVLELADRQFVNVDARLAELRGGSGGFSLSGLTVVSGGTAVPLSLFQGMFANDDEIEVGGSGDLISPWGGFINGTISWGDQNLDNGNRNVTLDYDSYALTAGVDYRFSSRAVAGVALGYSNFDSELTEQGELTAKGFTLSGYGSYYVNDRFYVDGRVSYNLGDLDHVRFIRFGNGGDVIDLRATGSTDSSQLALALGAGYHYNTGPWVITPSGFVRFIDVSVDGFTESGAGANSAIFGDQDISTVQAGFGLSVTRAFSLRNGVISPQLDINFIHESTDDLTVQARLVGADPTVVFTLEPDDPDQSYGNVGLGFVYVTANGRQAYLSYRETFGQDGLSSGTLNLGARFEF
ncbi:MAG: autotransporter domain-containing protein [Lysobacterales bacterium]